MTPSARVAAAIDVLDRVLEGEPAERCLTRWSRASRFAGSKDRAAVRDLVYDAIRCRNSYAFASGALTGRGLILGGAFLAGHDLDLLFNGVGYGASTLSSDEVSKLTRDAPSTLSDKLDFDPALEVELTRSLGEDLVPILSAMRSRAPVDLRANFIKCTRAEAIESLATEGIFTETLDNCTSALRVVEGARKVSGSSAYRNGLVELQDVSSQRVAEFSAPQAGECVLDYCTGGGGKSLALGGLSRNTLNLHAFDVNPKRMENLPQRAERAGLDVKLLDQTGLQALTRKCDLVLVDAPCSGSGSWRRLPQQKWVLSEEKLQNFNDMQDDALQKASAFVSEVGRLVYATCSLFHAENERRVDAFLTRNAGWVLDCSERYSPLTGGDGFFVSRLRKGQKST